MHILTGKPYSFTAHAHDIFLPNPYLSGNLTAAQTVVTISEYNRRFLISSGTPAKKITVIPCGLDLQEFCVQPDRTPAHGTIVSIGRLDPIKGFLSLIDACALLQERGVPFACEIVGEGPQRRELEQQIHAHGLREKFHLLGALSQAQVREVLARAELFVLPSVRTADGNQDGIPVALMEAMALGIPVISTQVSGIPELVIDEVSGLLIPPQDARALAAALERLLGNASLREKVAAGGSQMVRAHHDIALSAAQMQTVFDEARRAA
jgi:glycosyltransferase involved in cell wall biosynthesis